MRYLAKHLPNVDSKHLDSHMSFTTFLVNGHNYVNLKLGKRTVTWEEAQTLYSPAADPGAARKTSLARLGLAACLILVLAACFFRSGSRCGSAQREAKARRTHVFRA